MRFLKELKMDLDVHFPLVHERVRHADGHHVVNVYAGVRVDDERNTGRSAENQKVKFPL